MLQEFSIHMDKFNVLISNKFILSLVQSFSLYRTEIKSERMHKSPNLATVGENTIERKARK